MSWTENAEFFFQNLSIFMFRFAWMIPAQECITFVQILMIMFSKMIWERTSNNLYKVLFLSQIKIVQYIHFVYFFV